MKVRWLIRKNHVNAYQVRDYADRANICLMDAKKILVDESYPVLQYRCENEWGFYWQDVPLEVEYRNETKDKS
jgi:hypothetical protein